MNDKTLFFWMILYYIHHYNLNNLIQTKSLIFISLAAANKWSIRKFVLYLNHYLKAIYMKDFWYQFFNVKILIKNYSVMRDIFCAKIMRLLFSKHRMSLLFGAVN